MPTPVTTARQCLTQESVQALDEAVAVARRRCHSQTTSLHAVSALLSLPSSALRDACARARNNSYNSRIQFKALELCLSASLDRLPSSAQEADEPPVSNSLMAAIKRSQANQRRQPENFHVYQQQQQQQSSVSTVKVELQNLIVSILDDPVVSRVFGDAGFRNCDIKLAILRPVHQLFRYKRTIPMFLCNLDGEFDMGFRGFSFPFSDFNGFNDDTADNCKRIGEILVRKKGRNPMLVGVSAIEVLKNFLELVQSRRGGSNFPLELSGLSIISIENEVLKFVTGNYDVGMVKLRFDEVGEMVEQSIGPGGVIHFGDLKALVSEDDACVAAVSFVVSELSRLIEVHDKRVWLIGVSSGYETYLKFVKRFPSIEKDWDLQLLPIISLKPSMRETCTRSSLTESFVPLGGFFSTRSDMKNPLSSANQCVSRCHLCNEKCEQEVTALSKGGFTASVSYQYPSSLPSWLEMPERNTNKASDVVKANDSMILSAKVIGIQKKWDNICQRLHYAPFLAKPDTYHVCSQVPTVVGFQVVEDMKENVSSHSNADASSNVGCCKLIQSCRLVDVEKNSTEKTSTPTTVISKSMNVKFSETEDELSGLRSPPHSLSSSSVGEGLTSPTLVTSVATDLGLGIKLSTTSRLMEKPSNQIQRNLMKNFSGCLSANGDEVAASNHTSKSSSCPCPDFNVQLDRKDFKKLYTTLTSKIGRQEDAVIVISQTIARCRTRNEKRQGASRGDIWFNFLGPDRLGKKKIAIALAEILYGVAESFICVDLFFEDGMNFTDTMFGQQEMNSYDMKFRGKTVVDYIADELRKKPLSVVYLENIDKSDPQVQNSLSYAVRTGRLSDSHGREVSVGNAVFVTTLKSMEGRKIVSSTKETSNYPEENIVSAKGWPIQLLIGFDLGDNVISQNSTVSDITRKSGPTPVCLNKRKLIATDETLRQHQSLEVAKRAHTASKMPLDLNLPAEDGEASDIENSDSDPISDNAKAWLEDFLRQMDETVIFKPFDFDALADKKLKEITRCFHKIVGSEGSLEIDSEVIEQILAAVCSSDSSKVDDWVNQVLGKAFEEVQKRYNLSSRSVVKLVTCQDQEQAPGLFLPARIIMN